MNYKIFKALYNLSVFEAFNIKTLGDLQMFLNEHKVISDYKTYISISR